MKNMHVRDSTSVSRPMFSYNEDVEKYPRNHGTPNSRWPPQSTIRHHRKSPDMLQNENQTCQRQNTSVQTHAFRGKASNQAIQINILHLHHPTKSKTATTERHQPPSQFLKYAEK